MSPGGVLSANLALVWKHVSYSQARETFGSSRHLDTRAREGSSEFVKLKCFWFFFYEVGKWVLPPSKSLRLSGAPKCPPSWSSRKSPCSWFPAPSIKSPRCGMLRPPYSVGQLGSRGQGRDTVTCYVVTGDCDTLTCHVGALSHCFVTFILNLS